MKKKVNDEFFLVFCFVFVAFLAFFIGFLLFEYLDIESCKSEIEFVDGG